MRMYGIKTCGSVKKAMGFFKAAGIAYDFVDLKSEPVDEGKIRGWLTKSDLKTLLNTKGTKYRSLGLGAMDLNDDQKVQWMARENLIIKRPVIETDDGQIVIGYDEARYGELFGG